MQTLPEFAGNDYLGFAAHPALPEALASAAREYGLSYKSSRGGLGWTDLHERYERAIESFMGISDACLLHATYLGGAVYCAVVASMGIKTVYCDEMAHSNLQLGMRGAGLTIRPYRHLDATDLRAQILAHSERDSLCIITDSIFGISGELSPIPEIVSIAREFDAQILIDDAHGLGIQGTTGRGVWEQFQLNNYPKTTLICTMTKAMGCDGGFLISNQKPLIDACRKGAIINGGAIPPAPIANACLTILNLFDNEPWRREKMFQNRDRMLTILDAANIPVVNRSSSIVCMAFKTPEIAQNACALFLKHGLRIPYFKYASEPRHNLLRAAARTVYTDEHLELFEKCVKGALRLRSGPGK